MTNEMSNIPLDDQMFGLNLSKNQFAIIASCSCKILFRVENILVEMHSILFDD